MGFQSLKLTFKQRLAVHRAGWEGARQSREAAQRETHSGAEPHPLRMHPQIWGPRDQFLAA